jgi:hypothetical protein
MPVKNYKFNVDTVKTKYDIIIGKGDLEIVRYIVLKTDWCGETLNTLDYNEPLCHNWGFEDGRTIKQTLKDGTTFNMPLYGWLASFEYHKRCGDIVPFRKIVTEKLALIKKNGGFSDILNRRH